MSSGYSAKASGWLLIGGQRYELAQVGDCSCITRDAVAHDKIAGKSGCVVVEIDGQRTERKIKVVDCCEKTVGFLPEE